MLIGAHVSPAGGPAKAVARGEQRGARAIQIFNQNPRAWKPRSYSADEIAAFHAAMAASDVDALLIHAAYLLNCASEDPEIRAKTLDALTSSLRAGSQLGAHAVVLHPGSALRGAVAPAIARAAAVIAEALAESDGCPLHLENTAGTGGTLGRSFEELAALIDAAGGDERLGVCLDSCHLLASGFEIRTQEGLDGVLDRCVALVGGDRLGSLHLNDSQTPLGSQRDRHANVGEGEIGSDGCAVFLSHPRFDGLPCVLETPGRNHSGPSAEELRLARALRARGLAARRAASVADALQAFGLDDDDRRAWEHSGLGADAFEEWLTDRVARRPAGRRAREVYGADDVHDFARRAILDALALGPHDHLLDVGCGGGLLLRDALASGARVTGLDHSEEMVDLARERAPAAEVVVGSAERLPFDDGSFTAVAMSVVFFFLADPIAALSECRRVLAPGGRIAVYTTSPALRGTPAAPEPLAARGHFYEDEELATLARDAGFAGSEVVNDGGGQLLTARETDH